ncbi:transposase [Neobacillus sp. NRS-1170]|uniref:transposase n=1 Tax=Neobacillus sp. NRS-1170 TaxID=3233898 RepID=UPI003D26555A
MSCKSSSYSKRTIKEKPPEKSYDRQSTISLYWKLNQKLTEEGRQDLNYTLTRFPDTQKIYAFVQYFRECINNYDSLGIQKLISSIKKDTIPEIKSFLYYLQKELQAILLSIHYKYSNGVIEGLQIKDNKKNALRPCKFPIIEEPSIISLVKNYFRKIVSTSKKHFYLFTRFA